MNILGVSALYHDSAACLVKNGKIVAAAQEERFTRKKHDSSIPQNAIAFCLEEGKLSRKDIDILTFYDKPITKFVRLLDTYIEKAPSGFGSFLMAIPAWLKEKSFIPYKIEKCLHRYGYSSPKKFYFTEHHIAHASSAFYPSPFKEAAIVTMDGVGEWTTTAIFLGEDKNIEMLFENRFPHSLGLLYSAFTYFTGFKVNSGEYKLMGLAPYGEPIYVDIIKSNLIQIKEDGSFKLNMEYFGYLDKLTMTNKRFEKLFNGSPRIPETPITKREMDMAKSIQVVTEEIILKTARYAKAITGKQNLCLAGGVALNCVANGKILVSGLFNDIWIQPAAGDAGGALGSALFVWHQYLGKNRFYNGTDSMNYAQLGPAFSNKQIKEFLDDNNFAYNILEDEDQIARLIAESVSKEKVIGLFQGRMEFGPRALCNRSIIADARSKKMQSYLNMATKFRESFRPFAPVVLEEDVSEYFEMEHNSPYMLLVAPVKKERCNKLLNNTDKTDIKEWVNTPRSDIPAITHVDFSARVQTVNMKQNPFMFKILKQFKKMTGYSIMVNTSFNVRGEPIVCTPEDAYKCFMRTGLDILVLENFVLFKDDQPEWKEKADWRNEYILD